MVLSIAYVTTMLYLILIVLYHIIAAFVILLGRDDFRNTMLIFIGSALTSLNNWSQSLSIVVTNQDGTSSVIMVTLYSVLLVLVSLGSTFLSTLRVLILPVGALGTQVGGNIHGATVEVWSSAVTAFVVSIPTATIKVCGYIAGALSRLILSLLPPIFGNEDISIKDNFLMAFAAELAAYISVSVAVMVLHWLAKRYIFSNDNPTAPSRSSPTNRGKRIVNDDDYDDDNHRHHKHHHHHHRHRRQSSRRIQSEDERSHVPIETENDDSVSSTNSR
jgi:hypothetical protein